MMKLQKKQEISTSKAIQDKTQLQMKNKIHKME